MIPEILTQNATIIGAGAVVVMFAVVSVWTIYQQRTGTEAGSTEILEAAVQDGDLPEEVEEELVIERLEEEVLLQDVEDAPLLSRLEEEIRMDDVDESPLLARLREEVKYADESELLQRIEDQLVLDDIAESKYTDLATDGGEVVSMEPAIDQDKGRVSKLWTLYKHDQNRKKVGESGYVRWVLIDDTVSEPKYIKPERKGGGVMEYEYDGETYLFPRESLKPDGDTGMWTAIHHEGDALPINIDTPGEPSISTDELKEYLTQRGISSSSPSPLSFLSDYDASDYLKFILIGFIGLMLAQSFLGGGF